MSRILQGTVFVFALVIFAIPFDAAAQSNVTTGMVRGTVVDADGRPLEVAAVEARNLETGFSRSATTDRRGDYSLHLLPPGRYEIEASIHGLQRQTKRGIGVTLGSLIDVNFALEPMTFEGAIEITAVSPIIETSNSSVAASVSNAAISGLPLNGRNFVDLTLLTPVAVASRGNNLLNPEVDGTQSGVNVGARSVQNSFNVDGATGQSTFYANQRGGEYAPFTFSQAAIEEFQVIRSSYDLQFSAGGAVINAITRSGSNAFRGEVFGFYRDQGLVEADALGNETDDFQQIQYGFAIGGPIKRDRVHFFVSFDQQDFEEPTLRLFDDFPAGRESDWEELTGLEWERETGLLLALEDARTMIFKLDWQLGRNHVLTARYNNLTLPENENVVNGLTTAGWSNNASAENDYDSVVVSLNSILTSRIVNEVFVQYSNERRPLVANTTSLPEAIIGFSEALFGQGNFLPNDMGERRWQLIDNISYSVGAHSIRGGLNLDFVTFEDQFLRYGGGQYIFRNWEAFLDGPIPFAYTQSFSDSGGLAVFDANVYAAYCQDEWRPSPNLSILYGLRYDYQEHEQPSTANPLYPLTGQIPNDGDNLSARVGVAWDPVGDGTSVVRGGAGLFYDSTATILDGVARLRNGVEVVQISAWCRWMPCPTYPDRWDSLDDLPPGAVPDIFVYDPEFENPETLRASIGYEREILPNLAVGADLVYAESRKLQSKQDQNLQPSGELTVDGRTVYERGTVYPDLGRIIMFQSGARAESLSFVLTVRKRFSDRWFLDASYTWSQINDNGSNERSVSQGRHFPEDHFDIEADWGPANFDIRHKFVVSGGVSLPYGFAVSGYVFARSGFPYTALHWDDLNGDGYTSNERSVVETSPGVFFHYDRNTFRQDWFSTVNLRLSKTFRLGGSVNLELLGEVFNLFNTDNLYTTRRRLSEGCFFEGDEFVPCEVNERFGENNRPGRPRQYQLGLKVSF